MKNKKKKSNRIQQMIVRHVQLINKKIVLMMNASY